MKKIFLLAIFILKGIYIYSSTTYTAINSGNWINSSTWQSGSIAPLSGNNRQIIINSGTSVVLNSNIQFGNGCELYVYGNLVINGDLTALNTLSINVTGTLQVNGNLTGGNGASLTISGVVGVGGDVVFENGGEINLNNGAMNIEGDLTGGSSCEIIGNGLVNIQGSNNFDATPASGVTVNSSLPVELIRFYAMTESNCVSVFWATASETNNDYFVLYRSYDSQNWDIVSTIDGKGTCNSISEYSFEDCNVAASGIVYYKLKQVDFDGASEESNIIAITGQENTQLDVSVYPNPITDFLIIKSTNIVSQDLLLQLYGANNSLLMEQKMIGLETVISLIDLPSSVYFLKITDGNKELKSFKVVKQ